ncbi:hypothetical protein ACIBTP_38105 [Streptomyces avidinii]|uniref:hypothetical protein n=1 Tax=Streptomyces avidinii TaxID=1895 RepID=UPI00379BE336
MSRVFRMKNNEFWWENPFDSAAHLGYVRFTCAEPVADAWEVKFPRYWVEYGGWCASRSMRLSVDNVAEHSVAEQIRDHILASGNERRTFDGLWAEVHDMGRAPNEAFDEGAEFWATIGPRFGQRGTIVIRNRDGAAVKWDDEPYFVGGTTYPLWRMSATKPEEQHIPYSMGWHKL